MEKSGNLFFNCHESLLLFLSIIENVCCSIHQYECAHVNLQQQFVIIFKCLCVVKDNTDIVWNELFQTVTGICLLKQPP